MSLTTFRPGRCLPGVLAACASLLIAPLTQASLIADGFVSGTGKYTAGTTASPVQIKGQNPFVPGFTSGWTLGTGSTKFHVDPASNNLTFTGMTYSTGGSVGVTGTATDASQTVARAVSVPTSSTYYMSGEYMIGDPSAITPGAYAFMGWGNSVVPDAVSSGSTLQGVYVGFVQTGETTTGGTTLDDNGDLVIRTRQKIGSTFETVDTVLVDGQATPISQMAFTDYFVVTKLTVNASGTTDRLDYWVNPTSTASDAAMSASALISGSVNVDTIASAADLSQLTFAESKYASAFSFDEPRIATTLADLAAATPTPEPTGLGLLVFGALASSRRSRRKSV